MFKAASVSGAVTEIGAAAHRSRWQHEADPQETDPHRRRSWEVEPSAVGAFGRPTAWTGSCRLTLETTAQVGEVRLLPVAEPSPRGAAVGSHNDQGSRGRRLADDRVTVARCRSVLTGGGGELTWLGR